MTFKLAGFKSDGYQHYGNTSCGVFKGLPFSNGVTKLERLKLDIKFYDISRLGNYSRGETIDQKNGHYIRGCII